MNHNLLLSSALLLTLLACNNSNESQADASDSAKIHSQEIDRLAHQAIIDSGVQVEYNEFENYLAQRPATSGILESEPLRTDLKNLLGSDYNNFLESMSEATELKKDSVYYTWGVLPDDAVKGISFILIDAKNNKLGASQIIQGKQKNWGLVTSSAYIPAEIKKKIADFK